MIGSKPDSCPWRFEPPFVPACMCRLDAAGVAANTPPVPLSSAGWGSVGAVVAVAVGMAVGGRVGSVVGVDVGGLVGSGVSVSVCVGGCMAAEKCTATGVIDVLSPGLDVWYPFTAK